MPLSADNVAQIVVEAGRSLSVPHWRIGQDSGLLIE